MSQDSILQPHPEPSVIPGHRPSPADPRAGRLADSGSKGLSSMTPLRSAGAASTGAMPRCAASTTGCAPPHRAVPHASGNSRRSTAWSAPPPRTPDRSRCTGSPACRTTPDPPQAGDHAEPQPALRRSARRTSYAAYGLNPPQPALLPGYLTRQRGRYLIRGHVRVRLMQLFEMGPRAHLYLRVSHWLASRSADRLGWILFGSSKMACVCSTVFKPDDVFTISTSSSWRSAPR